MLECFLVEFPEHIRRFSTPHQVIHDMLLIDILSVCTAQLAQVDLVAMLVEDFDLFQGIGVACLQGRMHGLFRDLRLLNAVSQHMYPKIVFIVVCRDFNARQYLQPGVCRNLKTLGERVMVGNGDDVQPVLPGTGN